jgi:hypothetical protein
MFTTHTARDLSGKNSFNTVSLSRAPVTRGVEDISSDLLNSKTKQNNLKAFV